jgi:hypothetical protein
MLFSFINLNQYHNLNKFKISKYIKMARLWNCTNKKLNLEASLKIPLLCKKKKKKRATGGLIDQWLKLTLWYKIRYFFILLMGSRQTSSVEWNGRIFLYNSHVKLALGSKNLSPSRNVYVYSCVELQFCEFLIILMLIIFF